MSQIIDDIDRRILNILQDDARTPVTELARAVGLSGPSVHERLKKLEDRGVIQGYRAVLVPKELGLEVTAFVHVMTEPGCLLDRVTEALIRMPEVQECHTIAGDDCFILKVRTTGTHSLEKFLTKSVRDIPGVVHTRTTVVLSTYKEDTKIDLSQT